MNPLAKVPPRRPIESKTEHTTRYVRGLLVRMLPGERLPSEKDLQEVLGYSRITVIAGLRPLKKEGVIIARVGMGCFVGMPQAQRPEETE